MSYNNDAQVYLLNISFLYGENMPLWKCPETEVTKEKAEESIAHLKNACFGCSTHSPDCSIAKAVGEISSMIEE